MEIDDEDDTVIAAEPTMCSRPMLVAHSEYFKAMFAGNFSESDLTDIRLRGVSKIPFGIILKMIEDPSFPIEAEYLMSVLKTANMLQFLEIEKKCIAQALQTLSVSNCLEFWFFTEKLSIRDIYLKAKLTSLLEFDKVRKTDAFLRLSLTEVKRYLGNLYLRGDEFDVFRSIIVWFQHSKEPTNTKLLNDLILCVDFTSLNNDQIEQIIQQCKSLKYFDLSSSITVFNRIKNKEDISDFESKHRKIAQFLSQSKSRNVEGLPYFFIFNETIPQICSLVKQPKHASVLQLPQFKISPDHCGFGISAYKQLIFAYGGGSFRAPANLNTKIMWYDVINEKYHFAALRASRRHFVSCIVGNCIFLIGGTGDYRIVRENMESFDILKNSWSNQYYKLPCSPHQLKCCAFKETLILLNMNEKCIYQFSHDTNQWNSMKIQDPSNILPQFSEKLLIFSYKNHIYIKEKNLFQIELKANDWHILKEHDLPNTPDDWETQAIFCYDTLYIIETKDKAKLICLKTVNLNTIDLQTVYTEDMAFDIKGMFTAVLPSLMLTEELINNALNNP